MKLVDGQWSSNQDELKANAMEFYKALFTSDDNDASTYTSHGYFPCLSGEVVRSLASTITNEEVKQTVFR
ncbi:hypothetical protein V6N13_048286 [Hibiscus sabdariffa]